MAKRIFCAKVKGGCRIEYIDAFRIPFAKLAKKFRKRLQGSLEKRKRSIRLAARIQHCNIKPVFLRFRVKVSNFVGLFLTAPVVPEIK